MGTWIVYASRFGRARATVAMRWERRGDFSRLWGSLAERDGAPRKGRPAWRRVKKRSLGWYDTVIEELAARSWIRVEAPAQRPIPAAAETAAVRLRVDDENAADGAEAIGVDLRLVRRRDSTGIQLARLFARAVGTPVAEMSGAQRRLRVRISKFLRQPSQAPSTPAMAPMGGAKK